MTASDFVPHTSVFVLSLAALAFYTASRVGGHALGGRGRAGSDGAGPRTLAQWLPMATVAILAVGREPSVAVSIIFASGVACLSLALGTLFFAAPPSSLDAANHRGWPMVLPAAVLAMLAGFAGQFTLAHAAVFALQGLVALALWFAPGDGNLVHPNGTFSHAPIAAGGTADTSPTGVRARNVTLLLVQVLVWLLLTLAGAWLALRAVDAMTHDVPRLSPGLIAAVMISPALALPLIGSGLALAHDGRSGSAVSTAAGCVLLNLCALLPAVIIAWHVRGAWAPLGPSALGLGRWFVAPVDPLPFPMAVWRIDTVTLVMLGAMLIPMSFGRWLPGRVEGAALLIAYGAYLIGNARLGVR